MAQNRIYKFSDINEMQLFLNGALIGGPIPNGMGALVGLTLTFTAPAFALTFAPSDATDRDPNLLLFSDLKAQIEAENDAVLVTQWNGRIVFIEKTPSSGMAFGTEDEPAKTLLGFDKNRAMVGRLFHPPGIGGPPNFTYIYSSDSSHVVLTWE
jgi:hypothetical protein